MSGWTMITVFDGQSLGYYQCLAWKRATYRQTDLSGSFADYITDNIKSNGINNDGSSPDSQTLFLHWEWTDNFITNTIAAIPNIDLSTDSHQTERLNWIWPTQLWQYISQKGRKLTEEPDSVRRTVRSISFLVLVSSKKSFCESTFNIS